MHQNYQFNINLRALTYVRNHQKNYIYEPIERLTNLFDFQVRILINLNSSYKTNLKVLKYFIFLMQIMLSILL